MSRYVKRNDQYVLVDDQDNVVWSGSEVAIAFSFTPDEEIPGTLHKHGDPAMVNLWAKSTIEAYREHKMFEIAKKIHVMSGHISVEELNKMIDTSGYVGVWYNRLIEEVKRNITA